MNQKALVEMEIVKGERSYRFLIPMGAPYGEVYDACHEIIMKISELAKEAADKIKREESAPSDQA